jgi:hypothetical protein
MLFYNKKCFKANFDLKSVLLTCHRLSLYVIELIGLELLKVKTDHRIIFLVCHSSPCEHISIGNRQCTVYVYMYLLNKIKLLYTLNKQGSPKTGNQTGLGKNLY